MKGIKITKTQENINDVPQAPRWSIEIAYDDFHYGKSMYCLDEKEIVALRQALIDMKL